MLGKKLLLNLNMFLLCKKKYRKKLYKICEKSIFFNESWYLSTYPDVLKAGIDPIQHYLVYGANEGRNPGPNFSTVEYFKENPKLEQKRINPLVHFEVSRRLFKNIKTQTDNSNQQDGSFYEEQQDYSKMIAQSHIKILTYYLPQFYPIPENNEWHGEGFTEWVNVSSASPLFEGHYQQHVPHQDIGYYLLDTPATLQKQTDLMHKSGVHGQVFYHYWFDGKLILEGPSRLLLDNPNIQMPFCFCWANENWTRRWDGNEQNILLQQNYSDEDAKKFIEYLVPFFKDKRYLKVKNRPLLFIYRPLSIPDVVKYIEIWKEICLKNNLESPYLVAVLTRGAVNPDDFNMDAGVERVLHDWTAGNVPDIKKKLNAYKPLHGSILSYSDVANYYKAQTKIKPFTYFRSLVPMWDNTARYGNRALLVHNSTPFLFQNWLENTIGYTQKSLPKDRQFILIDAWNEWGEGSHLEPDARHGYAYLNSVGRALYARSNNKAKRILFLDEAAPQISWGAGYPRAASIINTLINNGCFVTIYPLIFNKITFNDAYTDIPRCVELILNKNPSFLRDFLKERLNYYDVIIVSRPTSMSQVYQLLKELGFIGRVRIVYDAEAIFAHRTISYQSNVLKNITSKRKQRKMIQREMKLADIADAISAVNRYEANQFKSHGYSNVHILGHQIFLDLTMNTFQNRKNILFLGRLMEKNSPNVDSILWFIEKVLPLIVLRIAEIELILVGLISERVKNTILKMAPRDVKSKIKIMGSLNNEQLRSYFDRAKIFIAPTRYAAGIPMKCHDAASKGLPIISSNLIARQLGWNNEKELLCADIADDFADKAIRLYTDSILWERLRKNAANRIEVEQSDTVFTENLLKLVATTY